MSRHRRRTGAVTAVRVETPLGTLEVAGDESGVARIDFVADRGIAAPADPPPEPLPSGLPGPVAEAARQLSEYFAGARTEFSLSLRLEGTGFQVEVWRRLLAVPYGATTTYGTIAAEIGRPSAVRAVGAANGANPLSIVVPCHRVIGGDGALTGYGGGLWRKTWLLAHEREVAARKGAVPT